MSQLSGFLMLLMLVSGCEEPCYKATELYVFDGITFDGGPADTGGWEAEESARWGTGVLWLYQGEGWASVDVGEFSIEADAP